MRELFLFITYIILFLIAMVILRNGLFSLMGERLTHKLQSLTNTPTKGFFTGMIFTAILQSSSAVMVMTVGLVSVGGISFQQSLGIILGSNIGTTITAEFMTFSISQYILPGIVLGIIMILIKHHTIRHLGFAVLGLFLIFFSIEGFKSLAKPLATYDFFATILHSIEHHNLYAILIGAIIAGLIHSGTATIGIAMGFIAGDQLSITAGIAIMLGSNIGTCVTGFIASLGSGREARLTSYAHIWLNVLGVMLFYPFIDQLQKAAAFFTTDKQIQLAHASVIFNIICSMLVLPIVPYFSKFILFVHKGKR